MNRIKLLLAALGSTAVVAGVVAYLNQPLRPGNGGGPSPDAPASAGSDSPSPVVQSPDAPQSPAAPATAGSPAVPTTPSPLRNRLDAILAKLNAAEAANEELAALKRDLLSGDAQQSIAAILEFLRTGADANTQQDLVIGPGGALEGAPTMRVFLMDLLGQLSKKTGSDAAATLARQTLETKGSADEWALSLRNVAWHEPMATPYLAGKMREMLSYEPWKANPSPGMLEAFDVIVFTRDPSFVAPLAEMLRGGASPLQRAAQVALDRLSEASPLAVMNYLNANPGQLREMPFVRADYFAKADLTDPLQRTALEGYLSRTDVSTAEKTKLLKALATPASFASDNLLTAPAPIDDGASRREALNQTLQAWKAQNRFPELTGAMQEVQQRIGR